MTKLNRAIALFLIFGVAAYGLFAYAFMPIGAVVHPDMMQAFVRNSTAIHVHVLAAVLALALGLLQF